MKKKSILALIAIVIIGATLPATAQYVIKKADSEYELFNYSTAADLYEQAYRKKASLRTAERLAEAYTYMNDYKLAESWYAIASAMPGSSDTNLLGYAKALQKNSKYSEAKVQFQRYLDRHAEVGERQHSLWLGSCDSAVKWMRNPKAMDIVNISTLNSRHSDWGAVVTTGITVFSSDRTSEDVRLGSERPFLKFDGSRLPDRQIYGWTGQGYLALYARHSGADSSVKIDIPGTSGYHLGPASFSADGTQMFFTMTRIPQKRDTKGKGPFTVNVEIFSSKRDEKGGWEMPVAFPYNDLARYSVSDPYITKDGLHLYFSSNMPGGKGGSDIYISTRNQNGDWGAPVNLAEINTDGNERTPSIDALGNMYFASDGYVGMGGLDVFKTLLQSGRPAGVVNMGYPFNSPKDDLAYFPGGNDTFGLLSSNRDGGKGRDDIYSVSLRTDPAGQIAGNVRDKVTGRPLQGAILTLSGVDGRRFSLETDSDGAFSFDVPPGNYSLSADKTGYRSEVANLQARSQKEENSTTHEFRLDPIRINEAIRIENIYYDFDRSNIRVDAAVELDKLVRIMKENPAIWIELGSHTDSRGNNRYNQKLSQRRVDAAVAYIISKGIGRNRITAKGYGESVPVIDCPNGEQCSEQQHQQNRRTEFKITRY